VPQFLGISKPILENIVFCHQDESLWPFGDNALLKNIFDELFETNKITKEMERVWDCHKEQSAQLK
jgi:DNA repair protein RAD50